MRDLMYTWKKDGLFFHNTKSLILLSVVVANELTTTVLTRMLKYWKRSVKESPGQRQVLETNEVLSTDSNARR